LVDKTGTQEDKKRKADRTRNSNGYKFRACNPNFCLCHTKCIENNTISKPKARKKVTEPILTPLLRQKKKEVKALVTGQFFTWCTTTKNPEYEEGLKTLPFESCLIHNKCNKKNGEIKPLRIQTKPKYFTHLQRHKLTENCDFEVSDYHTDSFKAANYRKIKAMKKFERILSAFI